MTWFKGLGSRDRLLLLATASLVGPCAIIAIGGIADATALLYVGVVSVYLGLSWVVPGTLVGVATKQSAERRGSRHPTRLAVVIGIAVGFAALVVTAGVMAAAGLGELPADRETGSTGGTDEQPETDGPGQAVGTRDEKIALVASAARPQGTRSGGVSYVVCQQAGGMCVVTYGGSACQLWLVQHVEGRDVARAIGAPFTGQYGMDDEDRPERVACVSSGS
jgi:hypothetical protein